MIQNFEQEKIKWQYHSQYKYHANDIQKIVSSILRIFFKMSFSQNFQNHFSLLEETNEESMCSSISFQNILPLNCCSRIHIWQNWNFFRWNVNFASQNCLNLLTWQESQVFPDCHHTQIKVFSSFWRTSFTESRERVTLIKNSEKL